MKHKNSHPVLSLICYATVFLSMLEGIYLVYKVRWSVMNYLEFGMVLVLIWIACITLGEMDINKKNTL